jgi:CheY-like chemotaxis protein
MIKSLRIAIADDEPDVRDYFCRILPLLGHVVVAAASNGRELVQSCHEQNPDLIIAGQICQRCPTPFILVSAYSKPIMAPDSLSCSVWTYLTKPIKRDNLVEAIQQLFAESGNGS